ncbi:DNA polymerase Y family protein [Hwanghaeella grinnelliae]|uniref:DNA-directed DNA polymerase n=1 Tax=Hwanghaeella grinnelliae TaxID=2500179 RepID=A0A3S2WAE4_9PROT|nr:DUF6504 family protein [Hwanghaeella grinnelliae]RVU37867.1 DNA polymerase Y family protein [Hwanghaeella grinnelliae]
MTQPRSLISLWLPYLATERVERRDPALAGVPFATYVESRGQMILAAVNPCAAGAGLTPGMSLANARALYPDVTLRRADPPAERTVLESLRDWCVRYTPWVALDGADGLLLDATGCGHLFGGDEAMLTDLAERLDGIGFTVRGARAETPRAAVALARFGDGAAAGGILRERLAPLPVEALGASVEAAAGLHRVGLHKIGDLYALPRSSLATRFGLDLVTRLDRALGDLPDAISPKPHAAPYRVRLSFPEPIGTPEDIARGLHRLLTRMTARLERGQRGCRRLTLSIYRADGDVRSLTVGVARAARDPHHLARLFAERLASLDPGFGIDSMVLAAPVVEDMKAEQRESRLNGASEGNGRTRTGREGDPEFYRLLDRLAARLGGGRLLRIDPLRSHLPERAGRFVSVFQSTNAEPTHAGGTGAGGGDPEAPPWPAELPVRPSFLLTMPEPVEAEDSRPEGEGEPTRFSWRGRWHEVDRVMGPERLSPEWWRPNDEARLRDYYRVESRTGQRFWMYRNPLQRNANTATGDWFMHGLFG